MMAGSAKDTVEEEALRRFDSIFRREGSWPLSTLWVEKLGHLSGDTVFRYQ